MISSKRNQRESEGVIWRRVRKGDLKNEGKVESEGSYVPVSPCVVKPKKIN